MMTSRHKQAGLSMIELMVAVSLSLILFLGVFEIFSSSKQTSRVQNELARLQENARFALDTLSHNIRMAGQLGCRSTVFISNNTGTLANFGSGLMGYEESDLDGEDILMIDHANNPSRDNVVDNTDLIVVMHASPIGMSATSTTTKITVTDASSISKFDPLVISDCQNADLFTAGNISNVDNTINIGNSEFFQQYAGTNNAQLFHLNYQAYYVREDTNGNKNLYRSYVYTSGTDTNINSNPLLEGVENLQIEYGEDISGNNTNIRYVSAGTAGLDMARVVSVRIHLLLATPDGMRLASKPQSYWFQNTNQTAADGDLRLFRSFTTTIQLRNQKLGT